MGVHRCSISVDTSLCRRDCHATLQSLFLQTALLAPGASIGALRDLGALLEPLAAVAVRAQPDVAASSPQETTVPTLLCMLCHVSARMPGGIARPLCADLPGVLGSTAAMLQAFLCVLIARHTV